MNIGKDSKATAPMLPRLKLKLESAGLAVAWHEAPDSALIRFRRQVYHDNSSCAKGKTNDDTYKAILLLS